MGERLYECLVTKAKLPPSSGSRSPFAGHKSAEDKLPNQAVLEQSKANRVGDPHAHPAFLPARKVLCATAAKTGYC